MRFLKLKNNQSGITVLELLIIVAAVAIAGLVVANQLNNRDAELSDATRISRMNQVQFHLELFYRDNDSKYPVRAEFINTDKLPNIPLGALTDADGNNIISDGTDATEENQIVYEVAPAGCNNTGDNKCTSYTLRGFSEQFELVDIPLSSLSGSRAN